MTPAPSPAESYLRDFHDRRPGATSLCFGDRAVVRRGQAFASSYACLAAAVPRHPRATSVLDVACGDGYLLAELAARNEPGLALFGIDFSAGELARARERLGDRARLIQGRAQSLPLADTSVDAVVSHMALMLMDDLDRVIAQIRRVLRLGGIFSAVVGGGGLGGPAVDLWLGLLRAANSQDNVEMLRIGDARLRKSEGLQSLLGQGFRGVEVDGVQLDCGGTPAQVWDWLSHTYDADRLSPGVRERMREQFIAQAAALAGADGKVSCNDTLRHVVATAA